MLIENVIASVSKNLAVFSKEIATHLWGVTMTNNVL